jgi:hypothetical protein
MENFNSEIIIAPFVAITALVVIYLLYKRRSKAADKIISDYYTSEGFDVISIDNLSLTEKIRYRAPLPIITLYVGFFNMVFSSKDKRYFRRLEVEHKNGLEFFVYVECYIDKGSLIEVTELDVVE